MPSEAVSLRAARPAGRAAGDVESPLRTTPAVDPPSAGGLGSMPLLLALGISVAIVAALAGRRARRAEFVGPGGSDDDADDAGTGAARLLDSAAATLAATVLIDSGLEHYRAGFFNKAMYVAPVMSACTLAQAARSALQPEQHGRMREIVFGTAALTGLVGFGFHLLNLSRREAGWSWLGLFYGAPVAAPLALTMAGALGLASVQIRGPADADKLNGAAPTLLGRPAGVVLGALGALGLLGTAAEAWLFHFRGAFQDPFMYVPIIVPPAAAVALVRAIPGRDSRRHALARALLRGTAIVGIAGVGFHAFGVQRGMGGWRNWTQNVLDGPPLPAPPAFTGLAFVGLSALRLLELSSRESAA